MTDDSERPVYFEGQWWLAALFLLFTLWLFLGGGLQQILGAF